MCIMTIWSIIMPNEKQQKIIKALKDSKSNTMRVLGRGTLVKDASDVKKPDDEKRPTNKHSSTSDP